MTMKVDKYLKLSARTAVFISWRGRLTPVLAGAARGETGSRGGEVRWSYWMFIPGNWRDFKTSWYAISCWRWTWSGVVSGSLWITQMDQHFWKVSWWDWVWMGTGRSEWVKLALGWSRVILADVYDRRWSGLKEKLLCPFKLLADMVRVVSGSLCIMLVGFDVNR